MIQANTQAQRDALVAIQPTPKHNGEDLDARDRRILGNMGFDPDQATHIISIMKMMTRQIHYDIVPTSMEEQRYKLRDGCMDKIVENGRHYEYSGSATKFAMALKYIGDYFTVECEKLNNHLAVLNQPEV